MLPLGFEPPGCARTKYVDAFAALGRDNGVVIVLQLSRRKFSDDSTYHGINLDARFVPRRMDPVFMLYSVY